MGQKTVTIWTTAPLPYLLTTVKVIELKKDSLRAMQNLKTVDKVTSGDKYSLLNRGNLTQPIQMNLSQKRKGFCQYSCDFWNLHKIVKIGETRWPSSVMYFWNYGLWKRCLDECLKSPVSEDPSSCNIRNGLKRGFYLDKSCITIFTDHC